MTGGTAIKAIRAELAERPLLYRLLALGLVRPGAAC
jgi:hypothetical protein